MIDFSLVNDRNSITSCVLYSIATHRVNNDVSEKPEL